RTLCWAGGVRGENAAPRCPPRDDHTRPRMPGPASTSTTPTERRAMSDQAKVPPTEPTAELERLPTGCEWAAGHCPHCAGGACGRCRTVVAFGTDALGRTVERCACGTRLLGRRPPPVVEDGRRHPRRNGVNPEPRGVR